MELKIKEDSITRVQVDAVVNPANSFGYMGGGVAGYLKKLGGEEIEEEAVEQAPFEIGTAVSTTAGELRPDHIIHAPTVREPSDDSDVRAVESAMHAALELAEDMELESIAVPGLGTGVGNVGVEAAAQAMIAAIENFNTGHLKEIYLIDRDEAVVEAWQQTTSR